MVVRTAVRTIGRVQRPEDRGVHLDELGGKGTALRAEGLAGAVHHIGSEDQERERHHRGADVADSEVQQGVRQRCAGSGGFLFRQSPQRAPDRDVDGGRHPPHQRQDESERDPRLRVEWGQERKRREVRTGERHHGRGDGGDREKNEDRLDGPVQKAVSPREQQNGGDQTDQRGHQGHGETDPQRVVEKESRKQNDGGLNDQSGAQGDRDVQPQGPGTDSPIAFHQALAGRRGIARTVLEEGVLEEVRQKDYPGQGVSGRRSRAGGLDQVRNTDRGGGPQQSRTEGFPEHPPVRRSGFIHRGGNHTTTGGVAEEPPSRDGSRTGAEDDVFAACTDRSPLPSS